MSDRTIPTTKVELLSRIKQSWNNFNDYLRSLTTEQITGAKDANGWMVKDFLIHLATWEQGVTSAMRKHPYAEGLGVDKTDYEQGVEHVNSLLQQRYHHLSFEEAREMLHQSHEYLIAAIHDLRDEDLTRSIHDFDPTAPKEHELVRYVGGDSYAHYDEHLGWLTELMNNFSAKRSSST
jgi:hypothetical protein